MSILETIRAILAFVFVILSFIDEYKGNTNKAILSMCWAIFCCV